MRKIIPQTQASGSTVTTRPPSGKTEKTTVAFDANIALFSLNHVFRDAIEGKVELAWIDTGDGKLRHAEHFDVGDLDGLVERAAEVNSVEGQNAFFGACLRRPDISFSGRASDVHFYMAPAIWADVDDSAVAQSFAERTTRVPPTMIVSTGKVPGLRLQAWWRLDEPLENSQRVKSINTTIASALGSDPSVVNPSRLMALPGSIKWPLKPGRVIEKVELILDQNQPPPYQIEALEAAYPAPKLDDREGRIESHRMASEDWIEVIGDGAGEGSRNQTAAQLVGYLFRKNLDARIVRELVLGWNIGRNRPPLADEEIIGVVESIAQRELRRRGAL